MPRGRKKKEKLVASKVEPSRREIYIFESKLLENPDIPPDQVLKAGIAVYHPATCPQDIELIMQTLQAVFPPGQTLNCDWLRLLAAIYEPATESTVLNLERHSKMLILNEIAIATEKGFKRAISQKKATAPFLKAYASFWVAALNCVRHCPDLAESGLHPMQVIAILFTEDALCYFQVKAPDGAIQIKTKTAMLKTFRGQNASLRKGANPFFFETQRSAWQFTESCRNFANRGNPESWEFHEKYWLPMVHAREKISDILEDGVFYKGTSGKLTRLNREKRKKIPIAETDSTKKVENITLAHQGFQAP
jgi:hypothetical protein